jgi:8-oxo-dGTP pyrophosphatase MutT (NUDIX family)
MARASYATTITTESVRVPTHWTVLQSNKILTNEWIKLRADRCVNASGQEISPYYVLEYRDWVNVVAFTMEGKVLLVNEYKHGVGRVCLGLPGGVIDGTDESPLCTAQRELLEETGYLAGTLMPTLTMTVNPAIQNNYGHGHVAFGCTPSHEGRRASLSESLEPALLDFPQLLSSYLRCNLVISGFDGASLWQAAIALMQQDDPHLRDLRAATRKVLQELSL